MVSKGIFLVGPMGAGKSTVGKKLSDLLGMQFCDSDQLLMFKHKSSIANIFTVYGEAYFRQQEQILIHELSQYTNMIVATGGGSILYENTRKSLLKSGVVCYLRVSPQQQLKRNLLSQHRPTLPLNVSQHLKFFEKMHLQRSHFYESIAHLSVETDDIDTDTVANLLIRNIKVHNENN